MIYTIYGFYFARKTVCYAKSDTDRGYRHHRQNILRALRSYDDLEIVTVSRKGGADIQADISSLSDIRRMYAEAGSFDAVICAAGDCYIGPFDQMTEEDMYIGIRNKMMGQINLVMAGKELINDKGSWCAGYLFLTSNR